MTSISSAAAAAGGTPISTATQQTTAANDQMGKDTFLKLLVAQLKYQDPMNPADGSQFLAQTAQFTSVEKLTEIAKQNEAMIQAQNILGASSLAGRTVSYLAEDGTTVTGVVSSVRLDPKGATVHVGNADIPVSRLTEVKDTSTNTANSTA